MCGPFHPRQNLLFLQVCLSRQTPPGFSPLPPRSSRWTQPSPVASSGSPQTPPALAVRRRNINPINQPKAATQLASQDSSCQIQLLSDSGPPEQYEPGEAVARWMRRFVDFIVTKRGLAATLHSGDPAYSFMPGYFNKRLPPALKTLLDAAVAAGEVRSIEADDLLRAVATLCRGPHNARRMVELLVDGLRYGARTRIDSPSSDVARSAHNPNDPNKMEASPTQTNSTLTANVTQTNRILYPKSPPPATEVQT